jgi:cation diffusion facilitator family transporter
MESADERRTTLLSIAAAAVLVALKLGVGLATGSLSLISAGIESSGDVVAAVLTFFAVRLGRRPADRGHPYGHRRAENLGALGESGILLAGAVVVTVEALIRLANGTAPPAVRWYQLAVIGVAIVVDVSRTSASLAAARRFNSPALRSNALHFGSDLVGSLAVLGGLLAVRAGVMQGDAVAALLVAAIILIATVRLMTVNADVLMDRTPWEARAAAERAITSVGEEIELDRLRLRESAGRYFADVVVSVPAGQALVEGHRSADLVEQAVERALPGSDVVVHVEPRARGLDLRERVLAIALAEPLVKEAHDIAIFETTDPPTRASVSLHLKFPADVDLRTAHETAERVERAIRSRPGVEEVQTHLEPLEQTLSLSPPEADADGSVGELVARVVRAHTGQEPQRLRMLCTDAGRVLFLTLAVEADDSLTSAHTVAGELEDELRRAIPDIVDVVVHTEPGKDRGDGGV